jgi:hypothetical protein
VEANAAIRSIPRAAVGIYYGHLRASSGRRQLSNKYAQCIAPLLLPFGDAAAISASYSFISTVS